MDQSVQRHHARELPHSLGQPLLFQYLVESDASPELVADMDGAGLTMMLSGNQFWIDGYVSVCVALPAVRR